MRPAALKVQKWAIWAGLIVVVYLLRHMFPIFFLTFVLSYIANTAVNAMTRRFPRRRLNVVIVYLGLLALLSGLVLLVVPRVLNEARNVARQYIATESARPAGGESVVHREAREVVDGVIIAISGRAQFEDFRTTEAYAVIVERLDHTLATATTRLGNEITIFANAALSFALNFVLSIILSLVL